MNADEDYGFDVAGFLPLPQVLTGAEVEACNKAFAIYPTLPSYKAMLDREGVGQPSEIALLGDESAGSKGIDRFRDAGVTDFAASIFPAGPGSVDRTRELLRSML